MKKITALVRNEILIYFREPLGAGMIILFPAILLIFFGFIYGNDPIYKNLGFVAISIPNYCGLVIATASLMGLSLNISIYRENKILKRYMASPLKPLHILISQFIVLAFFSLFGSATLILIAKVVFNTQFSFSILRFILMFLLICVSFFSFSFLISGVINDFKSSHAVSSGAFCDVRKHRRNKGLKDRLKKFYPKKT